MPSSIAVSQVAERHQLKAGPLKRSNSLLKSSSESLSPASSIKRRLSKLSKLSKLSLPRKNSSSSDASSVPVSRRLPIDPWAEECLQPMAAITEEPSSAFASTSHRVPDSNQKKSHNSHTLNSAYSRSCWRVPVNENFSPPESLNFTPTLDFNTEAESPLFNLTVVDLNDLSTGGQSDLSVNRRHVCHSLHPSTNSIYSDTTFYNLISRPHEEIHEDDICFKCNKCLACNEMVKNRDVVGKEPPSPLDFFRLTVVPPMPVTFPYSSNRLKPDELTANELAVVYNRNGMGTDYYENGCSGTYESSYFKNLYYILIAQIESLWQDISDLFDDYKTTVTSKIDRLKYWWYRKVCDYYF